MNRRIKIPVLLISLLFLLYACQEKKAAKEKIKFTPEVESNKNHYTITAIQFANQEMKLGMVSNVNISESINAAGYIDVPQENRAEVRSYIGGYLKKTTLLPGDFVKKGQLLISLENFEYIQLQQDYLQVKEELTYLKTVFDRQKILAEEKITSQNSMQQAESEYRSALANYEGLKKKLQLMNINPEKIKPESISSSINLYAPIDGYITKVNAVTGRFAEPTDVIFEIINTDHLHIELKVYEQDILKVKKGQELVFSVPEAGDKTYSGDVFLVGKTIDEMDRTVTVHCHISDDSYIPAIAGMYVEAEIFIKTHEGFCVPPGALISEEGAYSAYVIDSFSDGVYVFEKIKVEVGQVNDDCVEILDSYYEILEGKQILIAGAFDL